jgi:hypothetical protein
MIKYNLKINGSNKKRMKRVGFNLFIFDSPALYYKTKFIEFRFSARSFSSKGNEFVYFNFLFL